MIQWDESIVDAISRRRSVIVIGSGVSKNSTNKNGKRPPTWEEFLRNAVATIADSLHIVDAIDSKDFLTACELVKKSIGDQQFIRLIEREFHQAGYVPADIHKHIYNLDSAIVASPNFDNIYDTYASTTSAGTLIVKNHTDLDVINYLNGGEKRLLLKTHGSVNSPGNLIFTRKDYAAARTKYVLFYEILKSLVLTHTFLFIGCGIDDPDIRLLFEDVQFAHERMPLHYMTIPNGEVHDDILRIVSDSMKIKFLKYSSDDFHKELTESLDNLVKEVEIHRDNIAKDRKW